MIKSNTIFNPKVKSNRGYRTGQPVLDQQKIVFILEFSLFFLKIIRDLQEKKLMIN